MEQQLVEEVWGGKRDRKRSSWGRKFRVRKSIRGAAVSVGSLG